MPNTNLTKYQKGVCSTCIKVVSNFPPTIKILTHDIKVYFLTHFYYFVDDFTFVDNSYALCTSTCELSSVLVL